MRYDPQLIPEKEKPIVVSTATYVTEELIREFLVQFTPVVLTGDAVAATNMKLVEGTAFIIQVRSLNKEIVDVFCAGLIEATNKSLEALIPLNPKSKILEIEYNRVFNTWYEVADLRNFLGRYIASGKKRHKDGYFFVMKG
jgi:hypothetical protein